MTGNPFLDSCSTDLLPASGVRAGEPRHDALAPRLPVLVAHETAWKKWPLALLGLVLVGVFLYGTQRYWVPAHPGVDQNGYLVGGKMLADHGTTRLAPTNPQTHQPDPWAFVGRMWIGADIGKASERYYPKYPIGLSVLVALVLKFGGNHNGVFLTYLLSPACMTLALGAVFLLARRLAGSFAAVLAVAIIGGSQVTMGLTNNPNSHASTMFCVCWGMYFLFCWWQDNRWWPALAAGFLLGYAVTIRYSEAVLLFPLAKLQWPKGMTAIAHSQAGHCGLHILHALPVGPLGLVMLFNMHWRRRRCYLQCAAMLACWAIPVALLLLHNWIGFHSLTGYDPCNESEGFSWDNFCNNWETMVKQLYNVGLFFILPIGILGLAWMLWRMTRVAMVLWSWLIPGVLLYTAYYWAPDGLNIGYMRFFLTLLPPLALGAAWLMTKAIFIPGYPAPNTAGAIRKPSPVLPPSRTGAGQFGMAIGSILVVAISVAVNIVNSQDTLAMEMFRSNDARLAADHVTGAAPAGSMVIGPDQILNHLQFAGDYQLYCDSVFNQQQMQNMYDRIQRAQDMDPNQPQPFPFQPERIMALRQLVKNHSQSELYMIANDLAGEALLQGRRVFVVSTSAGLARSGGLRISDSKRFKETVIDTWTQPAEDRPVDVRRQRQGIMGIGPGPGMRGRFVPGGRAGGPGGVGGLGNAPSTWKLVEITLLEHPPAKPSPATSTAPSFTDAAILRASAP